MKHLWLCCVFFLPLSVSAQSTIPAGTILPVRLDTTLNIRHLQPNQPISARVMQNIPGTPVRRGARVIGRVVAVTPSSLELRFGSVVQHGRRIPISTNLRALASMFAVEQAYIPTVPPDRGDVPENWSTQQIGGDMVYRGGGHVMAANDRVGDPTAYGVRDRLTANGPCRAAVNGNHLPQSLWLFSSSACGVYDIQGLTVVHAGRSSGTIQLASPAQPLLIRSGSGLLLRVRGS